MKRHLFVLIIILVAMTCRTTANAAIGWPANYSGVMLQGFYWDSYDDSKWYKLTDRADELSTYFDLIWIPNAATETTVSAYESTTQSMGYTPIYYFKYNTIFGSEDQLRTMINTYKAKGTGIIEDVVINHKSGVTGWCDFANESVVGQNTGKTYTVTWDNTNYSGICCNDEANTSSGSEAYGKITGANDTGDNFDGSRDLDHTNATVQQNLITYQDYLLNELGFAGFRLDMVKGYSGAYTKLYNETVDPMFSVGEYWDSKTAITSWIDATGKTSAAFDFPLKYVINSVFDSGNWDALADKSFTADANYNRYAVTFVDNHDTFRGDDKLNSSWSAANAFILAMPGTPCVFLKHYEADKTGIGAMILARKACGITNQSTILQQYKYDNGYVIETQGTSGKVYLQLGDATGQTAPDGYTLVASNMDSSYGKLYKFYKSEAEKKETRYVYFNNASNWTKVYAYTWNTTTGAYMKVWPGVELTERTIDGYYKLAITDGISDKIIFSDGTNTNQTCDLDVITGYVYTYNDKKPVASGYRVYFDNTDSKWETVNCYSWNGDTQYSGSWPGTAMKQDSSTGYYYIDFTEAPANVIFNNGTDQTSNLTFTNGNIYKTDGSNSSYATMLSATTSKTVDDGGSYTATGDVVADKVTYTRSNINKWGTLCLPFACVSNDNVQFYTIKSNTSSSVVVTPIKDVPVAQPVIFEILTDADESTGKYTLSLTTQDAIVRNADYGKTVAPVTSWTINGAYEDALIQNEGSTYKYYIKNNQFWYAEKQAKIPTYRAWLEGPAPTNGAKYMTIVLEGEESSTAIDYIHNDDMTTNTIFNIQGQRLTAPQKGINIINGKKILVR